MSELVFELTQEEDGGFCAECLSENIFTQGDTWEAVCNNVQEAVRAYYFDQPEAPNQIGRRRKTGASAPNACRRISLRRETLGKRSATTSRRRCAPIILTNPRLPNASGCI